MGEGKNESDSLGSLVKLAYIRSLHKHRDRAARTVSEVAEMIRENLASSSEKLDFIEIWVVKTFERDNKPKGIPVRGIQKIHHFTKTTDGSIITREQSCLSCITLQNVCEECQTITPVYSPNKDPIVIEDVMEDIEDETEADLEEDEMDTSVCGEDDSDVIEDDETTGALQVPGTVVWARLRSWYPATICSSEEIPDKLRKLIPDHPEDEIFVKRFEPFNDVRLVKSRSIDQLGENRSDKARAAKTEEINTAYCLALATMRRDL